MWPDILSNFVANWFMGSQHKDIIILGIESSCDDTSASILKNSSVLSNETATQKLHAEYGGVVPEWASRAHQQNILPVVDVAIQKAGIQKNDIDAVAVTQGPGLLGSLLVGVSFAKSFAWAQSIPIIGVHHMQAHIMAHFIEDGSPLPSFPFLCLTVSGGHTQIVKVNSYFDFDLLGQTIDDAAGEAFDKAAKIMGIPYPGGPLIDQFAEEGDPKAFEFAQPKVEDFHFSFSGLKTSILYFLQKEQKKDASFIEKNKYDLCASIRQTIVEMLMKELIKASKKLHINDIAIAGGVSANRLLRKEVELTGQQEGWKTYIPQFEYCTDNAAMIGIAGYHKFLEKKFSDMSMVPKARVPMDQLDF